MFPGDGSAGIHAISQNLLTGGPRLVEFPGNSRVEQNNGVKIAVARMENIADSPPVADGPLADEAERRSDLSARDYAILDIVSGADAAYRAKREVAVRHGVT